MFTDSLQIKGLVVAAIVVAAAACGGGDGHDEAGLVGSDTVSAEPGGKESGTGTGTGTGTSPPAPPGVGPSADAGADATVAASAKDPKVIAAASCRTAVPGDGARALPLPVYGGTCPVIAAPPAMTSIMSSGAERKMLVFRPATIASGETLPVVFLWHWLGGSPEDVAEKFDVQNAVDARRFIAVIPDPKGDCLFRWPFEQSHAQSRVDEEAKFFDDMLACVGAALPANKECVSSAGVSAGALWTDRLGSLRSERLASIASLSGGVGGAIVHDWTTTPHRLPALVLWGGENDVYPENVPLVNFQHASHNLIDSLATDGHFIVECTHNCGHAVPPFDVPASGGLLFDTLWRFVLDHPYWLPASKSPYAGKPLPSAFPSWCGQGKGSAVPRASSATCL